MSKLNMVVPNTFVLAERTLDSFTVVTANGTMLTVTFNGVLYSLQAMEQTAPIRLIIHKDKITNSKDMDFILSLFLGLVNAL